MRYHIFASRLIRFLASRSFFILIVAVFILQAGWIALTARYPQAFDEQFHFGVIQIYAHHLSPFLSQQPSHAGQYGAIYRDPSYLYHYLMSFPYRLLTLLTASQTVQVIILRFLNIIFMAVGLVIFQRLLWRLGITKAATNFVLAFFILIPVTPLLAAQINYDNLFIPLVGISLYLTIGVIDDLARRHSWHWGTMLGLASFCLLTSLVKYPFLPIFAGIVLCIFITWWRTRKAGIIYRLPGQRRILSLVALSVLCVLATSLFVQRDGINVLRYGTPIPECDQVLSVANCQNYSPWARNYSIAQQNIHLPLNQVLTYPIVWLYHLLNELTFAISSHFNPQGVVEYDAKAPLTIPKVIVWTLLVAAVVAIFWQLPSLWRNLYWRTIMIVSGLYLLVLYGQNFWDYLQLGQPLSIHGRYLFPVLIPLAGMGVVALGRLTTQLRLTPSLLAPLAAVCLIVLFVQGGGFLTFIDRSTNDWFWPQSQPAQHVNYTARRIIEPVILYTH